MFRRLAQTVCLAVVALTLAAAAASADSYYTYCSNCVIKSGKHVTSNYWDAYRSYGQRTGGPGSGPLMRVTATGSWACDSGWFAVTQLWCDVPTSTFIGRTFNGGAGNYTFKAHLTAH